MQRSRRSITFILLLLLLVLFIFYFLLVIHYSHRKDFIYSKYSEIIDTQTKIAIENYNEMARLVYLNDINVEPVLSIVNGFVTAETEEERDRWRETLYQKLQPLYENLISFNFRQLHFHESDNRSLLRFHRPDQYGDDLTGIRRSVELVNRTGNPAVGFEEGRIFNGYRNVFPLRYNGRILGSVEISFSMKVPVQTIEDLFKVRAQFIILNSFVREYVFSDEQRNYADWAVDDEYSIDLNVLDSPVPDWKLSSRELLLIRNSLTRERENGSDLFSIHLKSGGGVALAFKALRNFDGDIAGYLFTVNSDEEIRGNRRFLLISTISFFIIGIFLVAFLIYYTITSRRLEEMIIHDQLTGALTRRVILERLAVELSRFRRYNSVFCIGMVDIDHFKQVNDRFGHLTGDAVLKEISIIFLQKTRNTDIFGRYGGEEFLVILPETTHESAFKVMDLLRHEIESHPFPRAGQVTISCGIAEVNDHILDCNELINIADSRLYKAKEEGRNRVIG